MFPVLDEFVVNFINGRRFSLPLLILSRSMFSQFVFDFFNLTNQSALPRLLVIYYSVLLLMISIEEDNTFSFHWQFLSFINDRHFVVFLRTKKFCFIHYIIYNSLFLSRLSYLLPSWGFCTTYVKKTMIK